jgi:hypothetical protein
MIRVGRCYYRNGTMYIPERPGYTTVVVLTRAYSHWGALGPCDLRDSSGCVFANRWAFSRVSRRVDAVRVCRPWWNPVAVWEHPSEVHVVGEGPLTLDSLTPAYWAWRRKGMSCPGAVWAPDDLGPSGFIGAFAEVAPGVYSSVLDCVMARKMIYVPLYCSLARRRPEFFVLRGKLTRGENLLIVEVNGPHQESLEYYQRVYGVGADFIESDSTAASIENLQILLGDLRHPFGHGYCLAAALLRLDSELLGQVDGSPAAWDAPDGPPENNAGRID